MVLDDSGYPLNSNLMTLTLAPVTSSERRYNRSFLKTRKTIECAFAIWKNQWRCMDKTGGSLCYSPEVICKIIVSTMVLHNFCIDHRLHTDIDISESEFPTDLDDGQQSENANFLRRQIVANYLSQD